MDCTRKDGAGRVDWSALSWLLTLCYEMYDEIMKRKPLEEIILPLHMNETCCRPRGTCIEGGIRPAKFAPMSEDLVRMDKCCYDSGRFEPAVNEQPELPASKSSIDGRDVEIDGSRGG